MELLFKHSKETTYTADIYENAGAYATLCDELEKAKGYWEKYFEFPESKKGATLNHVRAAKTYAGLHDYARAVQHLETYFALTSREDAEMVFTLNLGVDYLMLNNLEKACEWFDIAFARGSISLKEFATYDAQTFHSAILAYVLKGDFEKVQSVVNVLTKVHPQGVGQGFLLNTQTPTKKCGNARKKDGTKAKKITANQKASLSEAVQNHVTC